MFRAFAAHKVADDVAVEIKSRFPRFFFSYYCGGDYAVKHSAKRYSRRLEKIKSHAAGHGVHFVDEKFLSSLKRKSTRTTPDISRSSYILFVIPFTLSRISSGIFAGISLFRRRFSRRNTCRRKTKNRARTRGFPLPKHICFVRRNTPRS